MESSVLQLLPTPIKETRRSQMIVHILLMTRCYILHYVFQRWLCNLRRREEV
jgi:hypothetical protein